MCGVVENGCAPTHCRPSPPIWLKVSVLSSGNINAIMWQPMPPPLIEPSGVLVEVLCGQPEQKYGLLVGTVSATRTCCLDSMRARRCAKSPSPAMRATSTRATNSGVNSELSGSSERPWSSVLPVTAGLAPAGTWYSASLICSSTVPRFSSITSNSRCPAANSSMPSVSRGQLMATL